MGANHPRVRASAATAAGKRRASARTGRPRPSGPTAPLRPPSRTRRPKRPPRRPAPRSARRAPKPAASLSRLAIWRRRALVAALAAGGLAIAYFAWFRDSSLVAVHDVKVEGATTADRGRIVSALTDAAQGMTTLHVQTERLTAAVSGFPTVAAVSADPSFPHGLTVRVTEREPALIASDGHHQVAVAPDGWLLAGVHPSGNLPQLKMDSLPASGRLGGEALGEALTVGA